MGLPTKTLCVAVVLAAVAAVAAAETSCTWNTDCPGVQYCCVHNECCEEWYKR